MHPAIEKLNHIFMTIPFNQLLGLQLVSLTKESVEIKFVMKEKLIGNFLHGILHGGVISSVLDMTGGMSAMAHAIYAHPQATETELAHVLGKISTIDLHINYLNPGRGEHFLAKAALNKAGSKLAFARMELHNDAGLLIATGSGTYLL